MPVLYGLGLAGDTLRRPWWGEKIGMMLEGVLFVALPATVVALLIYAIYAAEGQPRSAGRAKADPESP